MRNTQQTLKLIFFGAVICGFHGASAWASLASAPSELSAHSPSEVLMVDDADRRSDAAIKAWFDMPVRATFDLGFIDPGANAPVTGLSNAKGGYAFAGGSVDDFIPRSGGPDGRWGTPGDHDDRWFEGDGDAREGGGGDRDGKRGSPTWFKNKRDWCPGRIPTPTAVPLPGSLLFFGSGLLGLAATLRDRRRA